MGDGLSKHEDEVQSTDSSNGDSSDSISDSIPTSPSSTSEKSTSGCPMKKADGSYTLDWRRALNCPQFPHRPWGDKPLSEEEVREKTSAPINPSETKAHEKCPVKPQEYNVYSQPIDPTNNMPKYANQLPNPTQGKALSTERVSSTIPKGGANEGTTWTYPSAQMFYNALARKGKLTDTDESDIDSVVALHNNMNEKTWKKILEWEETVMPNSEKPKLLKFQGRPTDLSPKAAFKHYIFGHPLPFDRHDWTIIRGDGTTVRYVIDYYHDESRARDDANSAIPGLQDFEATPSLLVDVRPALDSPMAVWNRSVTMPVARNISKATNFEPLPMFPSPTMRSQVKESVQVWESIQAATKGKSAESVEEDISEEDAKAISKSFHQILKDCRNAQNRMSRCQSDNECAKASVDLTICMAKILCPTQHKALIDQIGDDSSPGADERISIALENVNECVVFKTGKQVKAKEQFPNLFKN